MILNNRSYVTPYGMKKPPLKEIFKWKIKTLFKKKQEKPIDKNFKLKVHFINKNDFDIDEDFIVWLGHATFYIQLNGVKILCDPVFGDILWIKRLTPFPVDPSSLKPDIVLISHGHYDHFDLKSLEKLNIYKGKIRTVMPSNLSSYIKRKTDITELAWYENKNILGLDIVSLPASHWHRRGLFDFNKALWCSFLIRSKDKTIFFAGDTAFDSHFKEIKSKGYDIDIALMPIGAYKPFEIMKQSHLNPKEALDATKILDANVMIPYHYGTFILSDETTLETYTWIKNLLDESDIRINILNIGEIIII